MSSTLRDIKTFVSEGTAHIHVVFYDGMNYSFAVTPPANRQHVSSALQRIADMIMRDTESDLRGSGRTTQQLRDAPIGAVYVVSNGAAKDYTRRIAMSISRPDILIVTPTVLDDKNWVRSPRRPTIIVDHATRLVGR